MPDGGAIARRSPKPAGQPWISGAGITAALGRAPIAVALSLAALIHLTIVIGSSLPRYRKLDFSSYYTACVAIRQGKNPYHVDLLPLSAQLGLDSGEMNHIADTPPFLVAFEPLTLLPPRIAHALWQSFNLILLAASLWMLLGTPSSIAGLMSTERWSIAALALIYPPVAQNLMFAQTQIVILFLLVVAMRALEDGGEAVAGAAIALAGLLRAYPFLLLFYLAIRSRWSALRWALITTVVGVSLTFASLGIDRSLSWIHVLSWTTGEWQAGRAFNVAVAGFISRMFWYSFGEQLPRAINLMRSAAVLAAQLGFLALTVVASMRAGLDRRREGAVYALWTATAVVISPIAWPHYMVLLLIPFVTLATELRVTPGASRAAWMAAANFVLIGLWLDLWGNPVIFKTKHHVPILALMVLGEFGFVAALFGYLSAYWFAKEAPLTSPAPLAS